MTLEAYDRNSNFESADNVISQGAGSGEGLPSNTPEEAKLTEEYILPDEAPPTVQDAASIPTPVDPIAVPENPIAVPENPIAVPENPIAVPENPIAVPETKTNESLVKEENAQPEHVPVEEIKSTENPIKIEVAPEQVLVQEILVPASDNGTEKPQSPVAEASASNDNATEDTLPKESGDWQQREQELLKKIEQLEEVKIERSEDGLKLELKIREEEIDLLKARVKNLETELQAALSKPGGKNQEMIEKIKQQHEELLSKARGMIFDKTKIVKNQELQIEALTTQIQSLKDINIITKDLLEIRNSEIKAMEERLQVMETRFKGEKERYDLVLKRAQTSSNINDDLRKEYETQLAIFKELREKYEMRVQALVAENNRLKESVQGGASG